MYQPDINTYLEAIRQEFETIKKDNKLLKQENTKLVELNNHYFQKMNYYMELSKKTPPAKQCPMLKMGSDWSVEGDGIFEVSLGYKLVMEDVISSVAISWDGKYVAFVCGREVYVLVEGSMFILEESRMVPQEKREGLRSKRLRRESMYPEKEEGMYYEGYPPYSPMYKGQKKTVSKAVYFPPDSLNLIVIEGGGIVQVWDVESKEIVRTVGLPEVKGVYSQEGLLYVVSVDRTLRVYEKEKVVIVITTSEDLEGPLFLSQDREYVYCRGKTSLITFDLNRRSYTHLPFTNDQVTDMGLLGDLGFLCVSSRTSLNFYKVAPPRFISSNQNEECNYCLSTSGNVLAVGHKNGISFYDIKNKRKMKISIEESNTYNIDSCRTGVVTVENKNTLRVWKHGDVK